MHTALHLPRDDVSLGQDMHIRNATIVKYHWTKGELGGNLLIKQRTRKSAMGRRKLQTQVLGRTLSIMLELLSSSWLRCRKYSISLLQQFFFVLCVANSNSQSCSLWVQSRDRHPFLDVGMA
eukprot:537930-Amphidinium_carterae.1